MYYHEKFQASSFKNDWVMVILVIFGMVWFCMVYCVGIVKIYYYAKSGVSILKNDWVMALCPNVARTHKWVMNLGIELLSQLKQTAVNNCHPNTDLAILSFCSCLLKIVFIPVWDNAQVWPAVSAVESVGSANSVSLEWLSGGPGSSQVHPSATPVSFVSPVIN